MFISIHTLRVFHWFHTTVLLKIYSWYIQKMFWYCPSLKKSNFGNGSTVQTSCGWETHPFGKGSDQILLARNLSASYPFGKDSVFECLLDEEVPHSLPQAPIFFLWPGVVLPLGHDWPGFHAQQLAFFADGCVVRTPGNPVPIGCQTLQCSQVFGWHMVLDFQAVVVVNGHSGLEHPLGGCGLRLLLFTFGKCYVWPGAGSSLLEPDPMACFLPVSVPFVKGFVSVVLLGHFHFHICLAVFLVFSHFLTIPFGKGFFLLSIIFLVTIPFGKGFLLFLIFLSSSFFLPSSLLERDFLSSSSTLGTLGFFVWGLAATPKLLLMELEVLVLVLLFFSAASCDWEGPSSFWQGVAVAAAVSLPWPIPFFF